MKHEHEAIPNKYRCKKKMNKQNHNNSTISITQIDMNEYKQNEFEIY